jgi:16S rRNA (guanine966-N2)-methyltransferase
MSKHIKSNSIRIIAGKWRGRRLPVLEAQDLRPTTDRVRETVFNWLMHDVAGSRCLDVFAGSGALGLESLSRGAQQAHFFESNSAAANNINRSIDTLQPELHGASAKVFTGDALKLLSAIAVDPFDIVFLDPPFKADVIQQCVDLLENNRWLSETALVYLEYDKQRDFVMPPHWKLYRQGETVQSKYQLYRR